MMLPANTTQIRPTVECEAMNLVYNQLKGATDTQLHEMHQEAHLAYLTTGDTDLGVFAHQLRYEAQKRQAARGITVCKNCKQVFPSCDCDLWQPIKIEVDE